VIASARKGRSSPTLLPRLLRRAYSRHATKRLARDAGVPIETARNWVRGRNAMSAEVLLRLAASCEAIATALEWVADHAEHAAPPRPMVPGPGAAAERGGTAESPAA
jgi:outer membrane biogenesis lipoprotein LolB